MQPHVARDDPQSLETAQLARLKGKAVKVFLSTGVALSGELKEFDHKNLIITGDKTGEDTLIYKEQVTAVCLSDGVARKAR